MLRERKRVREQDRGRDELKEKNRDILRQTCILTRDRQTSCRGKIRETKRGKRERGIKMILTDIQIH